MTRAHYKNNGGAVPAVVPATVSGCSHTHRTSMATFCGGSGCPAQRRAHDGGQGPTRIPQPVPVPAPGRRVHGHHHGEHDGHPAQLTTRRPAPTDTSAPHRACVGFAVSMLRAATQARAASSSIARMTWASTPPRAGIRRRGGVHRALRRCSRRPWLPSELLLRALLLCCVALVITTARLRNRNFTASGLLQIYPASCCFRANFWHG